MGVATRCTDIVKYLASIIAMIVLGPIIIVVFAIYEIFWAPFPMFPRHILRNRAVFGSLPFVFPLRTQDTRMVTGGSKLFQLDADGWTDSVWSHGRRGDESHEAIQVVARNRTLHTRLEYSHLTLGQ